MPRGRVRSDQIRSGLVVGPVANGLLRCANFCHRDGAERLDRCLRIKVQERKKGQMDRRAQSGKVWCQGWWQMVYSGPERSGQVRSGLQVKSGAEAGGKWFTPVPRSQVRSSRVRSVLDVTAKDNHRLEVLKNRG